MSISIPKGTKCESCGMLAEYAEKGPEGAAHYYCSHHIPILARHSERSEESHNLPHDGGEISRRATPRNDKVMHDKHAGHNVNMFKKRFWVCLMLTIFVVIFSEMFEALFHKPALSVPVISQIFAAILWLFSVAISPFLVLVYNLKIRLGIAIPLPLSMQDLLSGIFASIIFFYGGWVFIKGALAELKHRLPGMMTLIALAIITAYIYSAVATFVPIGEPLFWEIATLITIMLLGHWIEMAAVGHASGALRELAKLLPDTAEHLMEDGTVHTVSVGNLKVGDVVLVRPGSKIPADGEIAEGVSSLNEAMITGESKPVDKKPGSLVIAGTVNGEGVLKVRVTKVGEQTALAGIMRLVAQAQASRSRVQVLADRAALVLTIVAVSVGAITAAAWLYLDAGVAIALTRTVAVLVIACPHALGVAVPLVASISTTLSARNGLLVREKLALELARKIDVVLFDKTGTLTKGEYGVTDIFTSEGMAADNALQLSATIDSESEHPVAKAIVHAAHERKVDLLKATEVKALAGRGVSGKINGQEILVGGENLVRELNAVIPDAIGRSAQSAAAQGKTIVYLISAGKVSAAFGVADIIREESRFAVDSLHKMGIKVAMVTGDAKPVAQWVAKEIGIDEYFAEVLPAQKVEKVQELQKRGMRVAMVGDGINDAPALTAADVGIAIGAGTDVAIESAGIILMKSDPRDIVRIVRLARATYRKMVENLIWATGYNAFAIPAAAGAFIPFGVILAPAFAAILMSVSTVVVAFNAQLLRRVRL